MLSSNIFRCIADLLNLQNPYRKQCKQINILYSFLEFFYLKAKSFTYLIFVVLAIVDMDSGVHAFFPNSQALMTKMVVKDIKHINKCKFIEVKAHKHYTYVCEHINILITHFSECPKVRKESFFFMLLTI